MRTRRTSPPSAFAILCSWLGTGIAAALAGAAFFLPPSGNRDDELMVRLMLFVAPAIVALILGWGIRYLMEDRFRP